MILPKEIYVNTAYVPRVPYNKNWKSEYNEVYVNLEYSPIGLFIITNAILVLFPV